MVERIPPPVGDPDAPLQALIFDSHFDQYRGVDQLGPRRERHADHGVAVAVHASERDPRRRRGRRAAARAARRSPASVRGEVGYLIAGIKDVGEARSGETVTDAARPGEPLTGYREPKPMVFCGLYPIDGDDFADLRDALEKLRLNDSSFTYQPETSQALGFGFRCGFLGLLHMEIVRERLEREFDLGLIATAPSVEYLVHTTGGRRRRGAQPGRDAGRCRRSSASRSRC